MGMRRAVALLESARVEVPMVSGWLRPSILVPVAALSGLTAPQLEAILAHELAHIRRRDYLSIWLTRADEQSAEANPRSARPLIDRPQGFPAPSEAEVWVKVTESSKGDPPDLEVQRNNVRIVVDKTIPFNDVDHKTEVVYIDKDFPQRAPQPGSTGQRPGRSDRPSLPPGRAIGAQASNR